MDVGAHVIAHVIRGRAATNLKRDCQELLRLDVLGVSSLLVHGEGQLYIAHVARYPSTKPRLWTASEASLRFR